LISKALTFLLASHPELGPYQVLSLQDDLSRGNDTYMDNLVDFHFELESSRAKLSAIVTVSVLKDE
jgi:hypothetical protein